MAGKPITSVVHERYIRNPMSSSARRQPCPTGCRRTGRQTEDAATQPRSAGRPDAVRLAPQGPGRRRRLALLVAAMATLAVPIAVRRMIDNGFDSERAGLIDKYFAVMILVVAVLAVASAMRYYLVTTIGERVVADLRDAVFTHIATLSAAFFDTAKAGELVSRLTADTTQIKAAVGSSTSVALRNLVLFFGSAAMMVWTSPRLSLFVLGAIPVIVLPLVGMGRAVRQRSRAAQDTLADASAYAAELIGAVRTLQAFTNEQLASRRFADGGRARLSGGNRFDPGTCGADGNHYFPCRIECRRRSVGRGRGRAVGTHDAGNARASSCSLRSWPRAGLGN